MDFYTARDLRTIPKQIWGSLDEDREVIITNNGKPRAMMINIPEGMFDQTVRAYRRAKWNMLFDDIRTEAEKRGFISEDEIAAEIAQYREEQKE